jgi:hypothetical protein
MNSVFAINCTFGDTVSVTTTDPFSQLGLRREA